MLKKKLILIYDNVVHLQTMRQIAIRIGEVRFQLQGSPVRLNGLWNISGIFVDRGQI